MACGQAEIAGKRNFEPQEAGRTYRRIGVTCRRAISLVMRNFYKPQEA